MNKILKSIGFFAGFTSLAIATVIILSHYCPKIISENYISYLIFNISLYAVSLTILALSAKKLSATTFVYIFLGTTVIKMLIAMTFILIITMNFQVDAIKDAILFMSIYFFFLIDEIIALLYLKNDKK